MAETEDNRKGDFEEAYNQAWAGWSTWQVQAKNDLTARLVHAYTQSDVRHIRQTGRDVMSFPQIRRCIKLITGYQRRNRLGLRYDPIENADVQTARQFTSIATWAMNYANCYNVISDAFEGALNTGLNLVNGFNDRNQVTRLKRLAYNQFLLHPGFSERDLSDCQYGIIRVFVTKETAKMLMPGKEAAIDAMKPKEGEDGKFPNFPNHKLYGEYLLSYTEWQRRINRKRSVFMFNSLAGQMAGKHVLNPQTGKPEEWRGRKEDARELLYALPHIDLVDDWQNTVEVTGYLEENEMFNDIDPWGIGDFSFTPIFCYWDPEYNDLHIKCQSLVRGLRDFQRADDKRIMSLLALIEQQIGSGLDFETGTLVDEKDAFKTGSGQPRQFTEGSLTNNRVRDRVAPDIPPGHVQIHELLNRLMPQSVNINEEMLGIPENPNLQIAGVLAKLRAGAGLVGLHDLFDNLSLAHKFIGQKLLKLYQQYPVDKVARIINEQPSPQFYNRSFGKYDCAAVEGVLTETQRNLAYTVLSQWNDLAIKWNKPLPVSWSDIAEYSPVQLGPDLLEKIKKQEQAQAQSQQRIEQMQNSLQQLALAQAKSQLITGEALAEERRAEAAENIADMAASRAETMERVQKLRKEPYLEAFKLAIELEKIKQGTNKEVKK
jgi:hypothetical protein